MSKLLRSVIKFVYDVLYGTTEYNKYHIIPVVGITEDMIKIVTPHIASFSKAMVHSEFQSVKFMIKDLKDRYEGHILLGDKGYYKIPVSNDLRIKRIEDQEGTYYKVYVPFIKLPGYQDYLDTLPVEILHTIFIKSQLTYKDTQDSFVRMFDDPYFSWKRLFQEAYPMAYQSALSILDASNDNNWEKLYNIAIEYKLYDFIVMLDPLNDKHIVLYTLSGIYSTRMWTDKKVPKSWQPECGVM